jgi:hypothetical protein
MAYRRFKITKNPYLLFLPLLIILGVIVLVFPTDGKTGDEIRYLNFVNNIINGFYSPPAPNIDLGNGPGYPLLIAPIRALNLPLVFIALLNPIFHYFSVVLLFKILQNFLDFRKTFVISLLFVFYVNSYEFLPFILTESLTIFLISSIVYNIYMTFNSDRLNKRHLILSGFFLGYLCLTKTIFGYVILVLLLGVGLLWIMNRKFENLRSGLIIMVLAFITTLPYLIYTYNLTGKVFYLNSNSGDNLYWMTSPNEKEYGGYISFNNFEVNPAYASKFIPGSEESFTSFHKKNFEEIEKFEGLKQDSVILKIAIENIKAHPFKYLQNCLWNVGRILFNTPQSYRAQTPLILFRLPFNGIILVLMLFCLIPTYMNWKKIPFSIRFLLFFTLIYLGGSSLVCAETRMFTVIVPILILWVAFIIDKSIMLKLKFS